MKKLKSSSNPLDYILPDPKLSCKAIKARISRSFNDDSSFTKHCEKVAELMGVTTRTVIKWCTKSPPYKLDVLIMLANVLCCDIKELYVCRSSFSLPNGITNTISTQLDKSLSDIIYFNLIYKQEYHIKDLPTFLAYAAVCDRSVLEEVLQRTGDYESPTLDLYLLRQLDRIRMSVPEKLRLDIDEFIHLTYSIPNIQYNEFEGEPLYEEYFQKKWNKDNSLDYINIKNANFNFEELIREMRKKVIDSCVLNDSENLYDRDTLMIIKQECQKIISFADNCLSNLDKS